MPKVLKYYNYECPLCFVAWNGCDTNLKKCKSCQRKVCIDCGCINENCKLFSKLYREKKIQC